MHSITAFQLTRTEQEDITFVLEQALENGQGKLSSQRRQRLESLLRDFQKVLNAPAEKKNKGMGGQVKKNFLNASFRYFMA